ncbi:MAG TPA: hypothetical protein VGO06_16435 [Bosea sp. (in: a-proteobacteria)]|jgi:hypothetical protein|uniref:hypothetical protein n=1 Tax=Bosea sp. (in: a-proteobacteria) TaxID=1871050 RepID=UPI002E0FB073|nr:hypothetical protein [Bosea sp. (in: a-proteobacteria)]
MKFLVVVTAALYAGSAFAQTWTLERREQAKAIDIKACVPSNPNCDCNPKDKKTCWFKLGDTKFYFDAQTREPSTVERFNAQ